MTEQAIEQTEAPAVAEAQATEATQEGGSDLDSLYGGIEFGDDEKADSGEKQDAPAEPAPAEEIKYEWEAPETFQQQFLGSEEGKKEYEEFQSFAKENGLKPEVFNHLMSKYAENVQKLQEGVSGNLLTEWGNTKKGWHEQILKDEEVGGQKYAEAKQSAALALKEFGTPNLAKELEETGFGHNPEIFKLLVRAGKAIGEGVFVKGKPATATRTPPHLKAYNNE